MKQTAATFYCRIGILTGGDSYSNSSYESAESEDESAESRNESVESRYEFVRACDQRCNQVTNCHIMARFNRNPMLFCNIWILQFKFVDGWSKVTHLQHTLCNLLDSLCRAVTQFRHKIRSRVSLPIAVLRDSPGIIHLKLCEYA